MKTHEKQWMTAVALIGFAILAQAAPAGKATQIEDGSEPEWVYQDCIKLEVGSGGSIHITSRQGASIETEFTGTGIEIYAKSDAKCGPVDVYIDGELVGQPNLMNTGNLWKAKVFEKDGLTPGVHKLKIVQTGRQGGIKLDFIKAYSN